MSNNYIFACIVLLVLISAIVKTIKNKQPTALTNCNLCHKEISTSAKQCCHCGNPNKKRSSLLYIIFYSVILVCFILYFLGDKIKSYVYNSAMSLPNCNSSVAKETLKLTFKNSVAYHTLGVSLVTTNDIKTISRTPSRVACSGLATLNNAEEYKINYEFYIKDNEVLNKLELTDE